MKIITTTVVLVCSFVLMGCQQELSKGPDQCLRQEIFKQCMASLPKGPQSLTATGNDWDEVVNSCDSSAQNYWSDIEFDRALSEVIKEHFAELSQAALNLLKKKADEALVAEKKELQERLARIEALEKEMGA